MHCAEVKRTEHRLWMRLVGLRHDVQLWDKDRRAPALPFNRPYKPLFTDADIAAGLAGAARGVADLAASVGAVGLAESERWISERLDPVAAGPAAGYLDGVELFLPVQTVKGPIAHLAGFAKMPAGVGQPGGPPSDAWGFEPGQNERFPGDPTAAAKASAAAKDGDKKDDKRDPAHPPAQLGALTEVVVLRDPPLVQVYRVESHGRKWRRALVFASSASWCLADVDPDGHPALEDPAERYLLSSTRLGAASSSLVISRHLTEKQGRQQFVPARHLRGLIPAAILKDYAFWQDEKGDLHGDPVPGASHPRSVIHAKLVKGAGADGAGAFSAGVGEHAAVIRRIPLRKDDDDADAPGVRPGAKIPAGHVKGQLTLIDLLYAPAVLGEAADAASAPSETKAAAVALRSVARCLAAVEGLAHCLAWTAAPVDASRLGGGGGGVLDALTSAAKALNIGGGAPEGGDTEGHPTHRSVVGIDRIELPRLGISFAATAEDPAESRDESRGGVVGPGGSVRLECEEHAGLFLSARRSPELDALLVGLPHSLLLEGRDGALSVLLPAVAAPRPALDRAASVSKNGTAAKDVAVVAAEEAAAVGTKGFGTDMVLDRWDAEWTRNAFQGCGGHYVYPVHGSHTALSAASLPSALYLALLRFLARRYANVCELSDLCVSDNALTPEEQQLWLAFAGVAMDPAPDACAARLRLSVAAFGTPAESLLPWDTQEELLSYVGSWRHVSASCRLSAREEQELLDSCDPEMVARSPLMSNRGSYLYLRANGSVAAAAGVDGAKSACPLAYPDAPKQSTYDAVEDRSALEEGITGEGPLGALGGLKHSFSQYEEKEVTGVAALKKIGEWIDGGSLALDASHGFPLLYELLNGSVPLRVLPSDDPHRWGSALMRFVPPEQSCKPGTLMSVLRILSTSATLAKNAPKVEEKTMGAKFSAMFTQDGAIGMLMRRVQPYLRDRAAQPGGIPMTLATRWRRRGGYAAPDMVEVPSRGGASGVSRDAARWALPNFEDTDRASRVFPLSHHLGGEAGPWGGPNLEQTNLAALVDQPMAELGLEKYFDAGSETADPEAARISALESESTQLGSLSGLPFDVGQHAAATTPIARQTLQRLKSDVKGAVEKINASGKSTHSRDVLARAHLKHLTPADAARIADEAAGGDGGVTGHAGQAFLDARRALRQILVAIRGLMARDAAAAREAAAAAASTANGLSRDPAAARSMLRLGLNRRSGAWAEATFDDLIAALLARDGAGTLAKMTPGMDATRAEAALHLAAEALLLTSRHALGARAAVAAENALAALDAAPKTVAIAGRDACVFEISLAAKGLANLLRTRRFYFDVDPSDVSGFSRTYDPRMLVFEYAQGIILRERQVQLVRDFTAAALDEKRRSECAQMLMGEGKTTVVCPLLGFMLASDDALVTQVVPQSLLEFSRSCLRSAFAGVVRRSVLTLRFDRFTPLTPAPLYALRKAKRARAVVVTTPTALKSLVLKFLECAHLLDQSMVAKMEGGLVEGHIGRLTLLFEASSETRSRSERVAEAGGLRPSEIAEMRKEGAVAAEIVKLFQSAGVLILDEVDLILHPLRSELHWPLGRRVPLDFSKSRSGDGLRWKLPFFLVDGIFACALGRAAAEEAQGSNEAAGIVKRIAEVVNRAVETKGVQSTPHVVLLDQSWYNAELMPLLAEWAELWLRAHGAARGVADHHMRAYLTRTKGAAEAARIIEQEAEDDSLKMINLARDWLCSLLPHVLSKINRVSYGLLSAKDVQLLESANGSRVPTSRRLLAVPFVGKDIPSQTNEFSHPDVVIGLTICTYRHEGLRRGDFRRVLRSLLEKLEQETGPVGKRPSAKRWAEFVHRCGRRVRGEAREAAAAAARRTGAQLRASVTSVGASRIGVVSGVPSRGSHSSAVNLMDGSADSLETAAAASAADALSSSQSHSSDAAAHVQAAAALLAASEHEVWPLQLVDLRDGDQVEELYRLMRLVPEVIEFYLDDYVFPKTAKHQGMKLSATGQELGGDLIFPRRLGFSGTPSDLLPLELGAPKFEPGTDAKVLATLTDVDVVSARDLGGDWDVRSLLRSVATADPPVHALIDVGALVTGLSNLAVARFMLEEGLAWAEGCVFLDEGDCQMVLLRKGWHVVPLARLAALDSSKRFTFYDQVHTTGMDIRQAPGATAALTLGKDMTLRDYAQGAWRMRQIGRGQRLELLVVPEVAKLIERSAGGGRGPRRRRPRRRAPAAARRRGTPRSRSPTASRRPRVARRQRHAIGERPGWPTRGATRG